jgi:curved DNA-binding protein CbpA
VNYYDELGVKPDATDEEIRAAFRRKAKQAHPDRAGGDAGKMASVNKAYETLSQPQRKIAYDRTGQDSPSDVDRVARDIVLKIVMDWMTSANNSGDMIKDVGRHLSGERLKQLEQIDIGTVLLRKLQRRIKRLKFNGKGIDLVRAAVDLKISEIQKQIERMKDHVANLERAAETLTTYEYEPEPQANAPGSWTVMTGGT